MDYTCKVLHLDRISIVTMGDDQVSRREWSSFREGDWHAYAKLYDRYYGLLNNYGYKFTRDVSLIEDTVHDLFVKLWNNRERLGQPESVKNYLYKSLRHILFRKLKWQSRFALMPEEDYTFNVEVSPDSQFIMAEEERLLQQNIKAVLSKLPARQQEVVYLRFYEGLSYDEIAEVMSISITSVYKVWYKALENLRGELDYLVSCLLVLFCWFSVDLDR